jgi:hypothetical protein
LFLCLSQEIPTFHAVEYLRIECVEEAKQLNFHSALLRVELSHSSHAGEHRSGLNLNNKSEGKKVEAVAGVKCPRAGGD